LVFAQFVSFDSQRGVNGFDLGYSPFYLHFYVVAKLAFIIETTKFSSYFFICVATTATHKARAFLRAYFAL